MSNFRHMIVAFLFAEMMVAGGCEQIVQPDGGERDWKKLRQEMVEEQLRARKIDHKNVLKAMSSVPRHKFVDERYARFAYEDHPLPIGNDQTISQPYIVAFMTQAIAPQPDDKVLEVGTGSGYQAAVLGEIVKQVYTIELLPDLAKSAKARLQKLGYKNIHVKAGDGYAGWPNAAPFDAIVVTCGAKEVPEPLFKQLKVGGKMVIPVGRTLYMQTLLVVTKQADGTRKTEELLPVRFVPLRRPKELREK